MSSFNAFGFFALTGGKRVATQLPGATYPVHHCHYTTTLKSPDDIYVAATLRVYSGAGDAPVPDNTIAFIVAKAVAPTGKPVELDTLYMSVMPGDVNSEEYEACTSVSIAISMLNLHLGNGPRLSNLSLRCWPRSTKSHRPSSSR